MKKKLRVLHVKNSLLYDGASIIEYRLATEVRDEIIFDWFLISDDIGAFEERFRELGSRIFHRCDFSKEYKTKLPVITFYIFLKNHHYDIVYFDTDFSGRSYWLLAARFAGIPRRIIHSHNISTEGGINPILHRIFKFIMLFSVTDYIACSRDAAVWLFPKSKVDSSILLKNGIDTEVFSFSPVRRIKVRGELKISEMCKVFGHVGRFDKVKNHSMLVRIFNELQKQIPDSKLLLIGDGELQERIKQEVSILQLEDKVIFVGNTDDVPSYLSAMDVFIFPSLFEGLGIAVIEAECSGLPAYVSDKVPDNALLTEYSKKIPLSETEGYWADFIVDDLANNNIERSRFPEIIREKGFDIRDSARVLSSILQDTNKTNCD